MLHLCSMKNKLSLLILIAVLSSVFCLAGEPIKPPVKRTVVLSGKITDIKSNELLAGVKIECSNSEKAFYSDLNGNFFILFQVTGSEEVKLEFSQIGYDSKILDIKGFQADSGKVYIDLQPE